MPEFVCIPPISQSQSFIVEAANLNEAITIVREIVGSDPWNYSILNLEKLHKYQSTQKKINVPKCESLNCLAIFFLNK